MTQAELPEAALADVGSILDYYLAEAGVEVAGRFLDMFEFAIRQIRQEPGIGSPRLALALRSPALRIWPIKGFPHLILYLDLPDGVQIWRVLHSARDIPTHLQE